MIRSSKKPIGNHIINKDSLGDVFKIVACPKCGGLGSNLEQENKQGSAFNLKLACSNCGWYNLFWTSKKKTICRNFDVNSIFFYAMRLLMLMNHLPFLTEKKLTKN